jgi:urocanate hydratase
MGGAQPLAAAMHGAAVLAIEVDPSRIAKRIDTRYCDRHTKSLDEALAWVRDAQVRRVGLSVALEGNAADIMPELVARGVVPDVLTDQTSAHDMLVGYVPSGMSLADAAALRESDPTAYVARATASVVVHVRAMRALQDRGAITFDYGNNIRTVAFDAGVDDAFRIPGFVPEYIVHCSAKGRDHSAGSHVRRAAGHSSHDELVLELFPQDAQLRAGSRWRVSASHSRAAGALSAGLVREHARDLRSRSTTLWRAEKCPRRS